MQNIDLSLDDINCPCDVSSIERTVKVDSGGYPYIDGHIELYDYDKDIPLAKEGDKVRLIIIRNCE